MQYFGGKSKIVKHIVPYLESVRKENQLYIEPFVGGCSVISNMSGERIGYDFNKYLIELYKAIQEWYVLPDSITKEEYDYIKQNKDENKALTGFVGFGCSFAAKWFGGYARDKKKKCDFAYTAKQGLNKKFETMQDVKFIWSDYKQLKPSGCLIYCDPPYVNTTQAYGTGDFDTEEFWNVIREWSKNNDVYISEYVAPDDFECVLEVQTKTDIRNSENQLDKRVEKLFKYKNFANWKSDLFGKLKRRLRWEED